MKTVGIATIHSIDNFGSLLQAFATQAVVDKLGYKSTIINYLYPNEYHLFEYKKNSPYAEHKYCWTMKLKFLLYGHICSKENAIKKHALFQKERERLLNETLLYSSMESLHRKPPKFDIYLTGSDQVWNPRYLREDYTYFLDFVDNVPKIAFSASFGTTLLTETEKEKIRPLLNKYSYISLRERSGVSIVEDICGKEAQFTCDPTLLLSEKEWNDIFEEEPIIKGDYILCYILTYTVSPYPYATKFIHHIQKHLKKKVIIIDEEGRYWLNPSYKSFRSYGPSEIINLFKNASFIISSSFHGAVFSVIFKKDFYSLFPYGINDERQESLLKMIGAEDRFIHVGDTLPNPLNFRIHNWNSIYEKLNAYRQFSINYLTLALANATQLTK